MTQSTFQDEAFANLRQGIEYLYSDGQFCDLVVTIGNDNFSCHRLVLAAVSGFFHSSLTSSWHEGSSGFVSIDHDDVTSESFQLLLDILYRRKDVVSMKTVKGVLKMSIFLRVKFLEEYCVKYLCDNLTTGSCLGAWQLAEKYHLASLADTASKMAATCFDEVAKCDELPQLPKAMLLTILSEQKNVNMDDRVRAIFCWAEGNVEERKLLLGELLPFVNFTELTPACLGELIMYFKHPFRDYIFDYISAGMIFNLQGIQSNNQNIQKEIRLQQDASLQSDMPNIKKSAVIVGGFYTKSKPFQDVAAFPLEAEDVYETYTLKPLPEACGLDFATCVWRNELYISGGSMQPKYFAVYKPGDNIWETLPALPQGREKHTIAAIDWTIYVLGGVDDRTKDGNEPAVHIMSFNLKVKVWNNFSSLQVAVKDATSSTLGHRIYVFGGQDVDGHNTDVVQCVDTLTGCVYTAGTLPSPTSGARALSNGGTIFVIRSEGDILQMKEDFDFADQLEKTLAEKKAKMVSDSPNEQGTSATTSLGKEEDNEVNKTVTEESVAEGKKTSTVGFQAIATFPSRQSFGAFLQEKDVVVCGGKSQDGEFLDDMVGVNYSDGMASEKLVNLHHKMAGFGLHILNIPQEFLTEESC